jgi:hypothetical protein
MDTVTYPQDEVLSFMNDKVIPVRLAFDAMPESKDFNVQWTPAIITLDSKGMEHHRSIGFMSPKELIPSMMLGMAKTDMDMENFKEAIICIEHLLKDFTMCTSAAEAVFLMGVARFKLTHETRHLKEAYEKLCSYYPDSEWALRAEPYKLL